MKTLDLPKAAMYLAIAAFLTLPAVAQNAGGDPHAHDWYKEQVAPKLKQQQAETPATTAAKSPADQVLEQSLGSVKPGYHGALQWFADDQIGLIVVGVIGALVIGGVVFAARKKKS